MYLQLRISSIQAPSLGSEAQVLFRLHGGTIGRARDNDWVLPDPERVISNHHARIRYERGQYFIEDQSTNGTFLNQSDHPLPRGKPTPLHHGDLLYIGDYEIQVALLEENAAQSPAEAVPPKPQIDPVAPDPAEFVAQPYQPAPAVEPPPKPWVPGGQAPLPEMGAGASQSDHLAAEQQHFRPPEAKPQIIEESVPPPAEEILPDDWWNEEGEDQEVGQPAPIPETSSTAVTSEFIAEPVPSPPESAPEPTPAPAHTPPISPETPEPDPVSPKPRPTSPSQPQGEPPSLQAFWEGLGLPPQELSPEEQQEFLRRLGRLLRLITQGTLELLKARREIKEGFRTAQTIVQPANNNPLKFTLDTDQALRQLFLDPPPGFLDAEAAFQEAFADLEGHELALIAGVKAAFQGLLQEFSPEAVEAAYQSSPEKKHRLFGDAHWDFYKTYYAQLQGRADDDFHGIFGAHFVRVYEAQLAQRKKS